MTLREAVDKLWDEQHEGVVGVGCGDEAIHLLLEQETSAKDIPGTYEGYPVIRQVTGQIIPA